MSDSIPPPPPSEPVGPTGSTGSTGPTGPGGPTGYGSGQPAGARGPSGMTGDQMKGALQGANKLDLAQIGLGVLIFIASLMPFYTLSIISQTAWHGFFGWFGVLLALGAAGVLVAVLVLNVAIPSMRMIVLGLFGAAALCLFIALFVLPSGYKAIGVGHGFGYWLALLCSLGAAALAFLRKDASE